MNKRIQLSLLTLLAVPLCWSQFAGAADRGNAGGAFGPRGNRFEALGEEGDCGDGCTLTQGYWKNHSAYAQNPNQQIPWPLSEDSVLCGSTWYEIINDKPNSGDVWLILAHQWIAARLNEASGASIDDLDGALDEAGALLADNCGLIPDELEEDALALAGTLDDYNNGLIGPGHCDDGPEVGPCDDCNGNGIDDAIDISEGDSNDANENGVPDECEPGSEPFCEGDGLEGEPNECPCGNHVPSGQTAGCINGDGVGAVLSSTGTPSVSNDDFVLHVDGIPNGKPGFFFQGQGDIGFVDFGNGLKCIGGPFNRLAKIAGQPGGNTYPPPGGQPISEQFNILPGQIRYYQVLYRDSQGPCGGTTNTSNGLKVTWGL